MSPSGLDTISESPLTQPSELRLRGLFLYALEQEL